MALIVKNCRNCKYFKRDSADSCYRLNYIGDCSVNGGLRVGCYENIDITSENPLDVQVGGSHYKNMAIQPVEFTHKNNLNFCQGNIVKYATRYKNKNGKEDLKKVIHYAELLIKLEYGDK